MDFKTYNQLQTLVGKRFTLTEMDKALSDICGAKINSFYAEEQNSPDHTFYFQRFDGKFDLDGTLYALPTREVKDEKEVWYITEINGDNIEHKTDDEIFDEIIKRVTRGRILEISAKDNERPMGFLLTYIKDVYGLPKSKGWNIAERVLTHYNIEN